MKTSAYSAAGILAISAWINASAAQTSTPSPKDAAATGLDGNLDAAAKAMGDGGAPIDVEVTDEMPYPPGGRAYRSGSVAASAENDLIGRWNRGGSVGPGAADTSKPFHPAPRIKVDLLKVAGHLDKDEVLRRARSNGYWPLRLCYEEGLRRNQKLSGTVKLRATVGPRGNVTGARAAGAELDDRTVVACLVKAAHGLAVASPPRGAPSITLQISLWPGDEPVRPRAFESAHPIDTPELVSALRSHLPEVRSCYADGVRKTPRLWGRIGVRLRIRASGEIVDASEIESAFPDPEVTFCVLKTFAHTDVPAPGSEVILVYPLRLSPKAYHDPSDAAPNP